MQKIIFALMLLMPWVSMAEEDSGIVPLILEANDQVKMPLPQVMPCPTCQYQAGREGPPLEQFKSCIEKVCPATPFEQFGYDVMDDKQSAEVDRQIKPLRQALEAYIKSSSAQSKAIGQLLEDLANGERWRPSDAFALSDYVNQMRDPVEESAAHYLQTGNVDPIVFEKFKDQITSEQGERVGTIVAHARALASDRRLIATGLNELGSAYKYRFIYPRLDFQSAARKDLAEALRDLEKAPAVVREVAEKSGVAAELRARIQRNRDPNALIDEVEGAEIQKVTDRVQWLVRAQRQSEKTPGLRRQMTDQSLDRILGADKERLKKAAEIYKSLQQNLDDGLAEMSFRDLSTAYWQNQMWVAMSANAKKYGMPESEASKPRLVLSPVGQVYGACVDNITNSMRTLPDKKSIDKFRRDLPMIRSSVKKGLKGRLSSHTQKIVDKYIDDLQFSPPPAKETFLQSAVDMIKRHTAIQENGLAAFRHDREAGLLILGEQGAGAPHEGLAKICQTLTYRQVRDNTVTSLGAVAVGSAAISNPHFGHGVCAHEIGHGVFHMLSVNPGVSGESKKKFEESKKCLTDLHKPFFDSLEGATAGLPADRKDVRPRDYFLVEDFADLISGMSAPGPNYWCQPNLGTDLGYPVIETGGRPDPHSLQTFRVLNVEANSSRGIPRQCNDYLKAAGYQMKKCL